jgi:hypothetical protein
MELSKQYRDVTIDRLSEADIDKELKVAGWIENIRDHGGVMFLDIRDQYGVTQVVVHDDALLEGVNRECSLTISGKVVKRDEETINKKIATGMVEVAAESITVLGKCDIAIVCLQSIQRFLSGIGGVYVLIWQGIHDGLLQLHDVIQILRGSSPDGVSHQALYVWHVYRLSGGEAEGLRVL